MNVAMPPRPEVQPKTDTKPEPQTSQANITYKTLDATMFGSHMMISYKTHKPPMSRKADDNAYESKAASKRALSATQHLWHSPLVEEAKSRMNAIGNWLRAPSNTSKAQFFGAGFVLVPAERAEAVIVGLETQVKEFYKWLEVFHDPATYQSLLDDAKAALDKPPQPVKDKEGNQVYQLIEGESVPMYEPATQLFNPNDYPRDGRAFANMFVIEWYPIKIEGAGTSDQFSSTLNRILDLKREELVERGKQELDKVAGEATMSWLQDWIKKLTPTAEGKRVNVQKRSLKALQSQFDDIIAANVTQNPLIQQQAQTAKDLLLGLIQSPTGFNDAAAAQRELVKQNLEALNATIQTEIVDVTVRRISDPFADED